MDTSRIFSEDVIQQSICCKLSNVLRGIVLIQGLQLGLALIELLVVSLKIIKSISQEKKWTNDTFSYVPTPPRRNMK